MGALEDSPVYFVNGVFNEEGIAKLQAFQAQLNEIISWSHTSSVENAIEAKLVFVEELVLFFKSLGIDTMQEMEYFINEEIGAVDVIVE